MQFKAAKQTVQSFNYQQKDDLVAALKKIITKNKKTLKRVDSTLTEYGIELVDQKKPLQAPVDGISFWSNHNPAIGMSLRYKRLDNFAFTLFHELGHIFEHLLNNNKAEFIDLDYKAESHAYKKDHFYTDEEIITFAKANKIHPCIVRGKISFKRDKYRIRSAIDFGIY